ncbi:MAG TPA: ABC transporter permease [Blastocatellia bacterium]|jgi:predicted permease|nr:ABC transporter permease [Blastocatellia bacterium]
MKLFRWRRRKEEELDAEIQSYLDEAISDRMERGETAEQARANALIEFGNVGLVKEVTREMWGWALLERLGQDLRFGLRMLWKDKGFTAIAVLSLALGIGANTAIFSIVDTVMIKMLPVKNPEQLFSLDRADVPPGRSREGFSYAFFEKARMQQELLAGVCAFWTNPRVNVALNGQPEIASAQRVTGGFFAVLGVNAMLGRTITEEDDKFPGAHPVVVISHDYWRRRFASDPAVVGKTILLNGHPFTIIGVTPPEFFGAVVGGAPDLWAPWMMTEQISPGDSIKGYFRMGMSPMLARLKPGVSEQQARTLLTELLRQTALDEVGIEIELWSQERQQALRRQSIALIPAGRGFADLGFPTVLTQFSEALRILMAVVGLILLIACANIANLSLARATARQKEMAVRLALGASRFRLIRQLLTESLLLAASGGALGLALAWWIIRFILALMASRRTPVYLNVTLDARALMFTAAASVLACILFGLAPAWRATAVDLTPALKDSSRRAEGGARLTAGKSLVVMQVALSLSLLIIAGLFARSLGKLYTLDAGFKKENVLQVSTDPRMIGYQGKQVAALYQRLLERFKTIPGVRSASLGGVGLLGGSEGGILIIIPHAHGRPAPPGEPKRPRIGTVTPEYFETVGMTILRGRGFTARDFDRGSGQKAVIVNEAFARYYFGEADPIGQRFGYNDAGDGQEIVGVVKDARQSSLREPAEPIWYGAGLGQEATTFQLRTDADPTGVIAAVRRAAREIDANLPLYNIKTLAANVDESLAQERLISALSGFFGLLSLSLAAVGLFGILAYAVSQRTREIGIRISLGAQPGAVLSMVLRQGLILTLLGVGIGLAASLGATRLLESQLFGVTPTDPATFVGAPILLLTVALIAGLVPARRATNVDPLIAIRQE